MQSCFLNCEFGQLHYFDSLPDDSAQHPEKTIIFLHGNSSSAKSFLRMTKFLSKSVRVIALDFPGHGNSERLNIEKYAHIYSFEGFKNILLEFCEKLEIKNYYLAGNSLGGNIAVQTSPLLKGLCGLILMSSVHATNREEFFDYLQKTAPLDLILKNDLTSEELKRLASAFIFDTKNIDNFKQVELDIQNTDAHFKSHLAYSIETQTWTNEQQILACRHFPILFINGRNDHFVNPSYFTDLMQKVNLSDRHFKFLDHVGHCPHIEEPSLCAEEILSFIQATD